MGRYGLYLTRINSKRSMVGEMAQQLRVLLAVSKGLGSISSTHRAVHNLL